jgi:hypothetical protein
MHQKHHRKPCFDDFWLYTSTCSKFPAAARPHVNSSMGLSENNVVSLGKITDFFHMGMDLYLYIPFLVGWTSIYQLFWCSPGVPGFWPILKWSQEVVRSHHPSVSRVECSLVIHRWAKQKDAGVDWLVVCTLLGEKKTYHKYGWWYIYI